MLLLTALSAAGSPMPHLPRLDLAIISLPAPAWASTPQAAGVAVPTKELHLRLINDGDQPVEADAPVAAVPEVLDEHGKPVAFSDRRSAGGYAPPQPPKVPGPPVRTGEARLLATYTVTQTEQGVRLHGPYGDALLRPGRYQVRVALVLAPITRERWIASYRAALPRRATAAEHEAERHAAHWREVPTYWSGRLESNPVVLQVP